MNLTQPIQIGEINNCGKIINCIEPETCKETCLALMQQQSGYFIAVPIILLIAWMLFSIFPDEQFRVKHIEKLSGITIIVLAIFFYLVLKTYSF